MDWIRERRKKLNITQSELAARISVNGYPIEYASISHWETGRRLPPLNDKMFVNALAKSLKVNEETVLRLSGFEVGGHHTLLGERGASIIDSLPDEKKKMALRILEAMLNE